MSDYYTHEQSMARFNATMKRMLGKPLNDEDWDAPELGPLNGEIEIKRPPKEGG